MEYDKALFWDLFYLTDNYVIEMPHSMFQFSDDIKMFRTVNDFLQLQGAINLLFE